MSLPLHPCHAIKYFQLSCHHVPHYIDCYLHALLTSAYCESSCLQASDVFGLVHFILKLAVPNVHPMLAAISAGCLLNFLIGINVLFSSHCLCNL